MTQPANPVHFITPLYGVKSVSFQLAESTQIVGYDDKYIRSFFHEGKFCNALALNKPDCLLWKKLSPSLVQDLSALAKADELTCREVAARFVTNTGKPDIADCDRLITALRLYRAGVLRRGVSWIVLKVPWDDGGEIQIELDFTRSQRRFGWSGQAGGFGFNGDRGQPYILEATDQTPFAVFNERWTSILPAVQRVPRFDVALAYYNESQADKAEAYQLLDLSVTLEALFLQNEDALSYRLATRCANLLGSDAQQRKQIFREAKDLYDLRSRIIHGESLKDGTCNNYRCCRNFGSSSDVHCFPQRRS